MKFVIQYKATWQDAHLDRRAEKDKWENKVVSFNE